jgi:hypothetical protein
MQYISGELSKASKWIRPSHLCKELFEVLKGVRIPPPPLGLFGFVLGLFGFVFGVEAGFWGGNWLCLGLFWLCFGFVFPRSPSVLFSYLLFM